MVSGSHPLDVVAIGCSANKALGAEALDLVADEGVQIHGGYGYRYEYAIEYIYRESNINRMLMPGPLKGELPLICVTSQRGMMPPELDQRPRLRRSTCWPWPGRSS